MARGAAYSLPFVKLNCCHWNEGNNGVELMFMKNRPVALALPSESLAHKRAATVPPLETGICTETFEWESLEKAKADGVWFCIAPVAFHSSQYCESARSSNHRAENKIQSKTAFCDDAFEAASVEYRFPSKNGRGAWGGRGENS